LVVGVSDGISVEQRLAALEAQIAAVAEERDQYRDLLCLLPRWPQHGVLELAPVNWRETLKQREAQQALDANVFRRVVLGTSGGVHRPQELQQPAAAVSDG
jgi:hypothetical protein